MTNEEIEKIFDLCLSQDIETCTKCEFGQDKKMVLSCRNLLLAIKEYIIRLKNDIKCEQNRVYNTAKDILQDWYNDVKGMGEDGYYVKLIAEQYGVTIEE